MRSGSKMGAGFAVIHNGLNISGGDTTSNGMNETGWQKDDFNLSNYDYDSNTNPITASLSSGGAKSYYQTSARKSTSFPQHRSSLLIVCPPGEPVRLTSIFLCVCLRFRNGLRIRQPSF